MSSFAKKRGGGVGGSDVYDDLYYVINKNFPKSKKQFSLVYRGSLE